MSATFLLILSAQLTLLALLNSIGFVDFIDFIVFLRFHENKGNY